MTENNSAETPLWTEGVCADGAAILRDGVVVPIEHVLGALNLFEATQAAWTRLPRAVEFELPTHAQCAAKAEAGDADALERFIDDNEPAGATDEDWRASLAEVLSEVVEEDRWACMPENTNPPCAHGFRFPVTCPRCEPEVYARARAQVERYLKRHRDRTAPGNHTGGQLALVQAYHRQRAALAAIRAVTGETQSRPNTALSLIDQLARKGLL